jgi:hypothetical protein
MTEAQLYDKLRHVDRKVKTIVGKSIRKNANSLRKMNIEQLRKGVDSNGEQLGKYKDRKWIAKRKKRNRQVQFVDLRFTGDFQKAMYVKFDGKEINFGSKDWKQDILVHHWGEEIFGLTDDNMQWLIDRIVEDLTTELKQYFA